MISNTPWNRSRKMKAKLYRDYPEDLRPGRTRRSPPTSGPRSSSRCRSLLLVTSGGTIGTIAVIGMIIFHVHITSTFPLAVPLEWNLFMIFGMLFLFGHYGDVPLSTLDDPLLIAILSSIGVVDPGARQLLRPDKISFLPSMRYYAGNWATSQWLFRKDTDAEEKLDRDVDKVAPIVIEQLTPLYDRELAEYLLDKGLAFRAMHRTAARSPACCPARPTATRSDDFHVREGELISGVVNGWNFGDGHFHGTAAARGGPGAVRLRAAASVRVVTLESQPAHIQRQRYRIYDAATGLIEEGWVDVADMVERGPWLEESWDFPVEVTRRAGDPSAGAGRSDRVSEAIVVGSGPNGLACAVALAREGVAVTVLEAAETIGGGTRTSELTVPGLLHDECSAVHPMAVGSPLPALARPRAPRPRVALARGRPRPPARRRQRRR